MSVQTQVLHAQSLRRDLVEPQSNLVISQYERLVPRMATEESSTLGSVHMKLNLPISVIEGKFIAADNYDECILGLALMRKYGSKGRTIKGSTW